jgi:hypothetical protein
MASAPLLVVQHSARTPSLDYDKFGSKLSLLFAWRSSDWYRWLQLRSKSVSVVSRSITDSEKFQIL